MSCFCFKITDRAVKLGRVEMEEWMANVTNLRQDTTGSYLEFCAEALPVIVGARFFRENIEQGKKMKSFVTVECEAMALTIFENVGGECLDVAQKKGKDIRGTKYAGSCIKDADKCRFPTLYLARFSDPMRSRPA